MMNKQTDSKRREVLARILGALPVRTSSRAVVLPILLRRFAIGDAEQTARLAFLVRMEVASVAKFLRMAREQGFATCAV